jgi:hypothetical protein
MKNTKKVFMFILSFFIILNAYGYEIENIEVSNDKTVNFSLWKDVQLGEKYSNSDVKVLEDLDVLSSHKNFEDQTKIDISLGRELKPNYSYSILTLFWAEWNMDFKLWNDVKTKINNTIDTWIKSINIKDSKTIEVTFSKSLTWDEFDFKILREIPIDKVVKNEKWWLTVTILENFVEKTNYMIVAISIKDKMWTLLTFEDWIYDFKTADSLIKTSITWTWNTINPIIWAIINSWTWKLNQAILPWKNIINSSTWNILWNWNNLWAWKELEKVALNAAKTPETWADTTILIILTFISSSIISFRKKFIKS